MAAAEAALGDQVRCPDFSRFGDRADNSDMRIPVALGCVALLAATAGCSAGGTTSSGKSGEVTVRGNLHYVGFTQPAEYFEQDLQLLGGDACSGYAKYSQVAPGLKVRVYDLLGKEIGAADLGGGVVTDVTPFTDKNGEPQTDQTPMTTCSFPFSVSVPAMRNYVVKFDGLNAVGSLNNVEPTLTEVKAEIPTSATDEALRAAKSSQ